MYRILCFDWLVVRARQAYLASLGFPDLLTQEGISIFGHIIIYALGKYFPTFFLK